MIDTTAAASAAQLRILRGLSPGDRLRLAMDMSSLAHSLLESRVRLQHPDWPASPVSRELVRRALVGAGLR